MRAKVVEHQDSARATARSSRKSRRVFIAVEMHFFRVALSAILQDAGMDVIQPPHGGLSVHWLREISPPADMLILALQSGFSAVGFIRNFRKVPEFEDTPILAISTLDRSGLDLNELRSLGVLGLVDKSATPEQLVFRVNQILSLAHQCERRYERAPVFLPVDLEVCGVVSTEYAISLSCGGLGVTSTQRLEPSTEVGVRFQLPIRRFEWIEAKGRIAYCRARPKTAPPFEVGLFFSEIDLRTEDLIRRQVKQSLAELDPRFVELSASSDPQSPLPPQARAEPHEDETPQTGR